MSTSLEAPPRNPISLRSVLLGLLGTCLICALTPYNDYALNNTPMVGNNLPVGAILFAFILAIFINGPLSRFSPRLALTSGELTVAFAMTLVACSLPSAGLLRYLPPVLVTPYYHAAGNTEFLALLEAVGIPKWLIPQFKGDGPREWINDPLVNGFLNRWTDPNTSPYAAWIVPILTWGVFLAALYGALLCMVVLVRRQWVENERLAFPLAHIGLALVEQPVKGRFFNNTLRLRSFWIGFALVFFLHLNNGLSNYLPSYIPAIPTFYNLSGIMADEPFSYARWEMKEQTIYFMVVGATFFIPSSIAFSLWFFFILEQIVAMTLGTVVGETQFGGTNDQHFGSIFAFAIAVFWVGRHHWAMILRQAFRGRKPGEPDDPYLPYPVAFWGLMACVVVMCSWLVIAGCGVFPAIFAVLMLLILFIVITRIVAESGIVHGMLIAHLSKPWEYLAMYGSGKLISLKSLYLTSMVDGALFDFREVTSVYASHGMKIADQTIDYPSKKRGGLKFLGVLALALFVGYFVAFGSALYTEYNYAASADAAAITPINPFGSSTAPTWFILDPGVRYQNDRYFMTNNWLLNPAFNVSFGFVLTLFLAAMRLLFAWWPLHPVGYLMLGTFPGTRLWFSIMLGWIAKTVIVRFGGAKLYSAARPFFLGLIVGESIATGFWMITGIALNLMGVEYRPIVIMPP